MNVNMQICGLTIIIMILIFIKTQKSLGLYRERIYKWVVYMSALTLVLDILSLVFIDKLGDWPTSVVKAACKIYIVSLTWTGWIAFVYMLNGVVSRKGHVRILSITSLINWAVMIASFILPIEIVTEGNSIYTQGKSTLVVYGSAAFYTVLILYAGYYGRKTINPRKKTGIYLWVFFTVSAACIQFFHKELLVISFALALGTLILFVLMENPDTNLDKALGCFNSYAKSLCISSNWEEKTAFSITKITFKTHFFAANSQEKVNPFLQSITNYLSRYYKIKVFKENDLSFILLSDDVDKLHKMNTEFAKWFTSQGNKYNTDFSEEFMMCTLENPYDLDSKDEIDQLFAFIRREHIYNFGKENIIDNKVIRMFKVHSYFVAGDAVPDEYTDIAEVEYLNEKKKKSLEMIDVIASEFDSVFYIDTSTGYVTPYLMNETVDYGINEIFNGNVLFEDALNNFVDKFIYAEDKEKARKLVTYKAILSTLKEKKSVVYTFRGIVDGKVRFYQAKLVKVGGDNEEASAFVLGFVDKDEEIRKQKADEIETARYNAVVKALSSEYANIYFVDLNEGTFIPYSSSDRVSDQVGVKAFANVTYEVAVSTFVNSIVCKDDVEHMLKVTKPSYIKNKLSNTQYFTDIYKNEIGDYCEMKCVRVDETENVSVIVIGFANKDNEIRQRQKQQEMLRDALDRAEIANKSKTDFLFNMSHDIRTPMNAIMGFNKMAIRDIDEKEKVLDYLSKTQKSGEILLSLINDILDMSRIESGKVQLTEESFDINNIFEDIEPMMHELAKPKNIKVNFSFGEIKNKYILCDVMRTQRILVNIISNAVKYSKNEGWVKVSCSEVDSNDADKANYKFIVEDNGIGMSDEFQTHLFEHFSREENSTTSGIQGTGLGLALCKALTDIMGGKITAESKQDVGSTFTVIIPFRKQDEKEFRSNIDSSADIDKFTIEGKRILLVEDNELNREIASDILSDYDAVIEEAENGQIAVDMVRHHPDDYYDLILMDIQMPVMNGYEAATQIREFVPDRHIPIIALSANAFSEDKQKSIAAGMDDHIPKPINIEKLITAISNVTK